MGAGETKDDNLEIKIGTLNYSGILQSPYEFFQKSDKEEMDLSNKMLQIYNNKYCVYEFGPLDKQWQEKRFSPLYMPTCGIKNNVHLMSKKQFEEHWNIVANEQDLELQAFIKKDAYQKAKDSSLKVDINALKKQYLDNLRKFDYLVYRSILEVLYTAPDQVNQLKNNFENNPDKFQLDSKKYKQSRKKMFKKPFLDEDEKISKTLNIIRNLDLDILFLQQSDINIVKAIQKKCKDLRVVKGARNFMTEMPTQSIIIIKQNPKKFPKFKSLIEENKMFNGNTVWLKNPGVKPCRIKPEQLKMLNLNEDTVIQFLYNIILISTHLTSKKQKNQTQLKELKNVLYFLKQKFPQCHIILAGDLNSEKATDIFADEKDEKKSKMFKIEPKIPAPKPGETPISKIFTVNKKRTFVQAQPNKGGQLKNLIIDYLISDLQLKDVTIRNCEQPVDFRTKNSTLLPSSIHPYDHYLLTGVVVVKNKLKHVSDLEYKYKYQPDLLTKQQMDLVDDKFVQRIKNQMKNYV